MAKTYSSDDIEIWNHVVDGSRSALGVLYQKYYALLFNFGLKYRNDEDFVKDCIHDLFVKICVSDSLSSTQYVRSYLLTALKNLMFDRIISQHICDDIDEISFDINIPDESINEFFERENEAELGQRVMKAVNQLPNIQREAIYLHYIKGLSHKEIAAMMNINPQSSMNIISRALTNLRKRLSPNDFFTLIAIFSSSTLIIKQILPPNLSLTQCARSNIHHRRKFRCSISPSIYNPLTL